MLTQVVPFCFTAYHCFTFHSTSSLFFLLHDVWSRLVTFNRLAQLVPRQSVGSVGSGGFMRLFCPSKSLDFQTQTRCKTCSFLLSFFRYRIKKSSKRLALQSIKTHLLGVSMVLDLTEMAIFSEAFATFANLCQIVQLLRFSAMLATPTWKGGKATCAATNPMQKQFTQFTWQRADKASHAKHTRNQKDKLGGHKRKHKSRKFAKR